MDPCDSHNTWDGTCPIIEVWKMMLGERGGWRIKLREQVEDVSIRHCYLLYAGSESNDEIVVSSVAEEQKSV